MKYRTNLLFAMTTVLIGLVTGCRGPHPSSRNATVRLATTGGSLQPLRVQLAKSLGYYDQEGVAIVFEEVASSSKTMQSIVGGSSDVATGGFMSVVSMNAAQRPVQAFFVLSRYPAVTALVSPRAQRQIRRVEDLDAATFGVSGPGSDEHMTINFVCSRHGISPDKVKVVGVGVGMSKVSAFEHGSVDAIAAVGTVLPMIQRRHPGVSKLFDLCTREGVREQLGFDDLAYTVLYARTDWIREHRDALRRIVRATVRAAEWARNHSPAEVRERLPASMRTSDPAVDADAIGTTVRILSRDGAFRPEHLHAAREILSVSNPAIRNQTADLSGSLHERVHHGRASKHPTLGGPQPGSPSFETDRLSSIRTAAMRRP